MRRLVTDDGTKTDYRQLGIVAAEMGDHEVGTPERQTTRRGRAIVVIVRPRLGEFRTLLTSGFEAREGAAAGVACGIAELLFDA